MSEIVTVPAGVIQPRELLQWLKRRMDEARDELELCDWEDEPVLAERVQTYAEVIQHISFGAT